MTCGKEPEPVGGTQIKKDKQRKHPNLSTNQMLLSAFTSPYPEA
jgi:hypothetical protein